jgi:hypothetical protein
MGKRILTVIIFIFFLVHRGFGQNTDSVKSADTSGVVYLHGQVINGDTIIVADLSPVIFGKPRPTFEKKMEEKQYWRLVYNLKKVIPYARLAKQKLDEMNAHFLTLKSEKEKKKYTKQVEDEIRAQFEDQLKALTITQGKLLIKLIYRETGNTSYELVKELRGGISAMFWQTLARLFGSNLKMKYEPNGEDRLMEDIVVAIENGML